MKTPKAAPTTTSSPNPTSAAATSRKTWIKKTPVDIVLEQIGKQETKVADMRAELAREERELAKLDKARQVLQGT